jgi:hypothetical protein
MGTPSEGGLGILRFVKRSYGMASCLYVEIEVDVERQAVMERYHVVIERQAVR